jgi:hypothetical protein
MRMSCIGFPRTDSVQQFGKVQSWQQHWQLSEGNSADGKRVVSAPAAAADAVWLVLPGAVDLSTWRAQAQVACNATNAEQRCWHCLHLVRCRCFYYAILLLCGVRSSAPDVRL